MNIDYFFNNPLVHEILNRPPRVGDYAYDMYNYRIYRVTKVKDNSVTFFCRNNEYSEGVPFVYNKSTSSVDIVFISPVLAKLICNYQRVFNYIYINCDAPRELELFLQNCDLWEVFIVATYFFDCWLKGIIDEKYPHFATKIIEHCGIQRVLQRVKGKGTRYLQLKDGSIWEVKRKKRKGYIRQQIVRNINLHPHLPYRTTYYYYLKRIKPPIGNEKDATNI